MKMLLRLAQEDRMKRPGRLARIVLADVHPAFQVWAGLFGVGLLVLVFYARFCGS